MDGRYLGHAVQAMRSWLPVSRRSTRDQAAVAHKQLENLERYCIQRIAACERASRMREEILTGRIEDLERQIRELNPALPGVRRPVHAL